MANHSAKRNRHETNMMPSDVRQTNQVIINNCPSDVKKTPDHHVKQMSKTPTDEYADKIKKKPPPEYKEQPPSWCTIYMPVIKKK
jgi:hypothetical protein